MKRLLLLLMMTIALPLAASDNEAPAAPEATPKATGGANQLFQVILLRGATIGPASGSTEIVGLPKNAEKAIKDMRDFLPFKSYRLLDSALLRVQDAGKARLGGIPPQQYEVRVAYRNLPNGKLSIWEFRIMAMKLPGTTPLPPGVAPEAERAIIDTSFTINLGETIVVGSSKLGGDQALIVLFTALPK
jgi:hypothetical protein